jgi:hypothetical protein
MGLGLPSGGGDFTPYVKYNAKAGRWYTKDDDGNEIEVTNMIAIFDFANIKTGWLSFNPGVAPEFRFDSAPGSSDAQSPGDNYKRGFVVNVFSQKNLGGVRELAANSGAMNTAVNDVYDAYEAAPERAQGMLPVVKCVRVDPVTSKHGTNYHPVLEVIKWAPRPPEFDETPTNGTGSVATPVVQTPATPSVPPPQPAPAAAGAGDEF